MKNLLSILLTLISLSVFGQASTITYDDKDKNLPTTNPRGVVRDVDLNEIKTVVNQHATVIDTKAPSNSPTLTNPNLGTPSAVTLTNATGLPVSTGISGLGSGVATWLITPSSANFAAAVTGETGTGAVVFGTSPTLTTPALGTPSAIVLTNGTGLPGTSVINTPAGGVAATTAQAAINELDTEKTASASFVYNETPNGTVNGSNLDFTLDFDPTDGTLTLSADGVMLLENEDYTISGVNITMTIAPTQWIMANFYRK